MLCLVVILVSFSLSGMPVNQPGVAKRIDHSEHKNINMSFFCSPFRYDDYNLLISSHRRALMFQIDINIARACLNFICFFYP